MFGGRRGVREALGLVPAKNATTDGLRRAIVLLREAADDFERELEARARDTAQRRAGFDPDAVLFDKLGRKRSPATIPGYMAGRPAPSRGRKYPPNPFTVAEIVELLNHVGAVCKNEVYAERLRALVLVLWRSGVRISEGLGLHEGDLSADASKVFVRRGKGGKQREIGVDAWLWPLLEPWNRLRAELPPGPYFCVVEGRTAGVDAWGASQVREKFADLQAAAGIRKRFRPHQLRHTMTCELILENKNIVIVQRQLGHANLAVTTNYTNGLPQGEVIGAMRSRAMPMLPVFSG
ncbi:integrase [Baekduia alba]|uniref:tyrosine-type recombinase/integrase n=1 Tax=Baekduia alba TaxID=2997333 RepID=UPI00234146DE|nr:tyrosine-type recombinase/integrase [Baekduia alba]WCB94470.1 integrase [Baekduia alba]